MTDTIRKGIIDVQPYENNTELLMVGNVAALTGVLMIIQLKCVDFDLLVTVVA